GARATDRTCVLRASAAAGHSPSPVAGRFPQRFHPAGLNALATSSVTRPALVRVGSSRRVLIKIGFGGGRATLSYCDWSGTGSKFFSNHSLGQAAPFKKAKNGGLSCGSASRPTGRGTNGEATEAAA